MAPLTFIGLRTYFITSLIATIIRVGNVIDEFRIDDLVKEVTSSNSVFAVTIRPSGIENSIFVYFLAQVIGNQRFEFWIE
jgi:hypothetical protein